MSRGADHARHEDALPRTDPRMGVVIMLHRLRFALIWDPNVVFFIDFCMILGFGSASIWCQRAALCLAWMALRMRVSKSAIGSVIINTPFWPDYQDDLVTPGI